MFGEVEVEEEKMFIVRNQFNVDKTLTLLNKSTIINL